MATFPSIKPTQRSFSLGEYPVKTYRSLSGKTVRRSFGNRPYGASLELVFENVKQATLDAIYSHYHTQQGATVGFALPDEVWAGLSLSSTTVRGLKNGSPFADSTEWVYAEPPSVESTQRDLSTISVKLVSEFRQ
jgi:hypothetical protein